MKRFTPARLVGPMGLVVVAAAAGTAMAARPPLATVQEAPAPKCESTPNPATPELPNPSASGDPYGPQKLVADALSKVCLNDKQRVAVEQLGKEVRPKEDVVGEARHAFIEALAEQLRSDHVDAGALEPEIDALVKAREEASPVMRKALEDLHGILQPEQRAEFVDAIEEDTKALRDASKSWFDSFASDLGLTDGQKERIKDDLTQAKADAETDRDRVKAEFEAFKGDTFSIANFSPESEVGPRTRVHAGKMVALAKEIADALTPAQRTKLADRIESKPVAGEPSTGAPRTGTPSTPTPVGTSRQGLVVGSRAGVLGGWGGGYVGRVGYFGGLGMGYGAGYPFIGTWLPGIW
ncbi:MAG TPA: Spy/CpxP family protein refolding chaperone [Polyangiaceae bacterium]|nr:Spy/CpxP family protein refolding chaperone [Polyangiaceae bacterium]